MGIEGSAIATLTGYGISTIILSTVLIRLKLLVVSNRFKIISLITAVSIFCIRPLQNNGFIIKLIVSLSVILIFFLFYKDTISLASQRLINQVRSKKTKMEY